mgnify:CR=1 FL=1
MAAFAALATRAAAAAGFADFAPDCCLVNRYAVGAQMGTHRDYDERDLGHPIVSVSIGLAAVFVWYGPTCAFASVASGIQLPASATHAKPKSQARMAMGRSRRGDMELRL